MSSSKFCSPIICFFYPNKNFWLFAQIFLIFQLNFFKKIHQNYDNCNGKSKLEYNPESFNLQ